MPPNDETVRKASMGPRSAYRTEGNRVYPLKDVAPVRLVQPVAPRMKRAAPLVDRSQSTHAKAINECFSDLPRSRQCIGGRSIQSRQTVTNSTMMTGSKIQHHDFLPRAIPRSPLSAYPFGEHRSCFAR